MNEVNFDLEQRVLCSDDTCIGLVGADGRCKVCGSAYAGEEPLPTSEGAGDGDGTEVAPFDLPATASSAEEVTSGDPPESVPNGAADDNERVCCPDDTCIGIIGKDGKCGTCGKTA